MVIGLFGGDCKGRDCCDGFDGGDGDGDGDGDCNGGIDGDDDDEEKAKMKMKMQTPEKKATQPTWSANGTSANNVDTMQKSKIVRK